MMKYVRLIGLAFFFTAAFALVTLLIRMKQDYVGEWEAPVLGSLVQDPSEATPAGKDAEGGVPFASHFNQRPVRPFLKNLEIVP